MKIFEECIQLRLVKWQCSRALRLLDRFGSAWLVRAMLLFTWFSTIVATILSVALMKSVFNHVVSSNPVLGVWVMVGCLVMGTVGCWTWSSLWGLGVLHQCTRTKWSKAYNDPNNPLIFSPRRLWQLRLFNLLLDPAGISSLRQMALARKTVVPLAGNDAHSRSPSRF